MNRNSKLPEPNLQRPHAILMVVEGERSGESFEIDQNELSIGRAPQNQISLQSKTISREHAVIRYHPETKAFTLLDKGSRNGTWQNKMEIMGEVKLEDGDEIVIGSSVFKFKIFKHKPKPLLLKKSRIKIVFCFIIFLFLSLVSIYIFRMASSKDSASTKTSEPPKVILTKVSGEASPEDLIPLGTSRMLVAGAVDANEHHPISCKIYFKISRGSGILTNFQKSIEGTSLMELTDAKSGLARVFLITKDNDKTKEYEEYLVGISSPNQVGIVEPFHILCVDKKAEPPADLLNLAKLESERAERFERDGRLYEAVRSWEKTLETVFPTQLNSPLYQQTLTKYNRTKARFDHVLEHEYNLARIAFEQRDIIDSLRHLEEIRSHLPNKNDPRYLKAKERALAISQTEKKGVIK